MHEFTEKFGITFANFLDLGLHSQLKLKLINISGERGHYLYLHKKVLHIGTTSLFGILHSSETDKHSCISAMDYQYFLSSLVSYFSGYASSGYASS